jgi:hypothetical protein
MSSLSDKFAKLASSIDETVTDFTTLDVITVSGNMKTIFKADKKFMKPADLIHDYVNKTSDINVEAFTHIDFDQDVIQFYRDGLKEEDLSYKLHQQAVESSKTARLAILTFIKEVVK